MRIPAIVLLVLSLGPLPLFGQAIVLEPTLVHLRSGADREWTTFPADATGAAWTHRFAATANQTEHTICLRQQDVKQEWRVLLNDAPIGPLVRDEQDTRTCLAVSPGRLRADNLLRIERGAAAGASDDIRIGEVTLHPQPMAALLGEAVLDVTVVDAASEQPLPARLTIVDASGVLAPTGTAPAPHLAVRPGVVYTSTGAARVALPAGTYTVYAGRGFEYSLAQVEVTLARGDTATRRLSLRRDVPMPGYVASDTHVHTFTHSRHGDATVDERLVTIAGEGLELPIATDHNLHVDYDPPARARQVRQYFTPVVGNEVTTPTAHFNVFPVAASAAVPDATATDWAVTLDRIFANPDTRVAILNHARDDHRGTRPFGPRHHNAAAGANLEGWPMRFNAMEVVNSGAIQTDPLLLVRDWMTTLNHGLQVAPIGSSDSHDVTRFIVGQGRTYIRTEDRDPGAIDVDAAVRGVEEGRVLVSYGLVADLSVNGSGPGDFDRSGGEALDVSVRVLAPHWITARRVQLYANGALVRQAEIGTPPTDAVPGVKAQVQWRLPRPAHDVHLVAVALGDGVDGPWWPTARPYQPTSPEWQPYTLGVSGAVWVDGDGDGRRSSAIDYAWRLYGEVRGDLGAAVALLAGFDAAVATQFAYVHHARGGSLDDEAFVGALRTGPAPVQAGFGAYADAYRESAAARAR